MAQRTANGIRSEIARAAHRNPLQIEISADRPEQDLRGAPAQRMDRGIRSAAGVARAREVRGVFIRSDPRAALAARREPATRG
jgi:hypothetical protein